MKEQIQAYLDGLNERERRMVYTGAVIVLLLIGYQFIWYPFVNGAAKLDKKIAQQQTDLLWMQDNINELRELSRISVKPEGTGNRSLYGVIETTAREKFGGNIQVQQEGQRVRVLVSNIPFDDIMQWLDTLQSQQQVVIKEFNAESTAVLGYVKSSILLDG